MLASECAGHCLPGSKINQSETSSRDAPAGGSGGVSAFGIGATASEESAVSS